MKWAPHLVSIIYPLLIFYGYMVKSAYYSRFDIDIYYYLTTRELLFPIFEFATFLLLFIPIVIPFVIYKIIGKKNFYNILDIEETSIKEVEETTNNENGTKNFKSSKAILKVLRIFSVIILFFWPFFLLTFLRNGFFSILNQSFAIFLISFIWLCILIGVLILFKKRLKNSINVILIALLLFLSLTIFTSYAQTMKAEKVLSGNPIAEILITTSLDTIASDKKTVFIGQTENYLFFRSLTFEETIIVSMSNIQKMVVKWDDNNMLDGDVGGAPRNWDNHPYIKPVTWDLKLNEKIIDVKKRQGAIILNNKYSFPWWTRIKSKKNIPYWLKDIKKAPPINTPTLEDIKPPYWLIKNQKKLDFMLIKNNDTLILTSLNL